MRRRVPIAVAAVASLLTAAPAQAAFPGANGRIAFQTGTGFNTMNSAGGDRQPLLDQGMSTVGAPTYSADGRRIAFSGQVGGDFDILTIGAEGGAVTTLTTNGDEDDAPTWSPDGSRIAFESDREGGHSQIYVMNADGTGVTRLTFDAREDHHPSWSPDGTRIVFARGPVGQQADIWVMGADGSAPTPLTSSDPNDEGNPDWSPDGTRIAFQRAGGIVVMGAGGEAQTPLSLPPGAARPAWAPDGGRIAFDAGLQLFAANPDGSGVTQLTTAGASSLIAQAPTWEPLPVSPPSVTPPGGQIVTPKSGKPRLLSRKTTAKLRTKSRYSIFTSLTVKPVRKGDTLRLTCKGRGCPLKRATVKVKRHRRSLSLIDRLDGARLRKGAVVQLRVLHAGAIGRVTTWRIRAPRRPNVTRLCLPPGKKKPTRC